MEELNYFPNTAARTLITNQTYKIGLVLKGVRGAYSTESILHQCIARNF